MALEFAMLEKDPVQTEVLAGQIKILLNESMMSPSVKGELTDHLDRIIEYKTHERNHDIIVLFKEDYLREVYDKEDYIPLFWQFGNDLIAAVTTAMDPKLDLYEWNEFEEQVICMEDSYNNLLRSTPDVDLLLYSPTKIQLHPQYFDAMRRSIIDFINASRSDNWEDNPLDVAAENLYNSYTTYLNFFSSVEWEENDTDLLK